MKPVQNHFVIGFVPRAAYKVLDRGRKLFSLLFALPLTDAAGLLIGHLVCGLRDKTHAVTAEEQGVFRKRMKDCGRCFRRAL
ncbi:MAG TPA: hypothetical protein VFR10_00550 [bacterium]|nr:hypothetical protein [bacterium]